MIVAEKIIQRYNLYHNIKKIYLQCFLPSFFSSDIPFNLLTTVFFLLDFTVPCSGLREGEEEDSGREGHDGDQAAAGRAGRQNIHAQSTWLLIYIQVHSINSGPKATPLPPKVEVCFSSMRAKSLFIDNLITRYVS
jgi:hypothetical protein